MKVDAPPPGFEPLAGAEVFQHGFLPAAAAYCRRLGLVELVNSMVPTRMKLKPGLAVQGMLLDVLSGRSPLYHVEDFMEGQDIELLLGEKEPASAFNDNNLGRALDAIFEAGPSRILAEFGLAAAREFSLDCSVVSYDTTSTSVWGEYRPSEFDPPAPGPVVTYGHSKDNNPDLKQFMTELLCVERGVPIFSRTLDGNSSDKKSNNWMLSRISGIMARHGLGAGAFVYVADSAMVTADNLAAMGANRFVTRLPATYGECSRVVADAVASGNWIALGNLAENFQGAGRPAAEYKVAESEVELYGVKYRVLVVHSSSHDKRRRKKLEKQVEASAKAIDKELSKAPEKFYCREDAEAAAAAAGRLSDGIHVVKATVIPFEARTRGRPKYGEPPKTTTRYKLAFDVSPDKNGIERLETLAGCFVLLSNVPRDGENSMDSRKLLLTYKGQYGVESDFAFLKDPLVVNDLFLKTPSRIDALGMILVMALTIWRLMERSMRAHVRKSGKPMKGWVNRDTTAPTAYMMSVYVTGIMVAATRLGRIFLKRPRAKAMGFINAMGLTEEVFTNPRFKCEPIIPPRKT